MKSINIFSTDIVKDLTQYTQNYKEDKIFVLADENTSKHCYEKISDAFERSPVMIEIPAGEKSKSIETTTFLWNYLTNIKADRKSLLINLGGGVITDIGGFVASTFKRGIDFINIPTSLIAQVDAAIGGKNGINLDEIKNQIGTFRNPVANIISAQFVETLPQRHITSGFAEIVKHSLLESRKEWTKIKAINPQSIDFRYLQHIIEDSAKIKLKFIETDPFEKNEREALNFGHTVGHALESFFLKKGVDILHGEAVSIGLISELFLSNKYLMLDFETLFEVSEYLATYFPSYPLVYDDYEAVWELMKYDKKNKENQIKFTLLKNIGEYKINNTCEKQELFEALNFYYQVKK